MVNYDVLKKANSGGAVLLGKSQLHYEDRWLFSKVAVSLILLCVQYLLGGRCSTLYYIFIEE